MEDAFVRRLVRIGLTKMGCDALNQKNTPLKDQFDFNVYRPYPSRYEERIKD